MQEIVVLFLRLGSIGFGGPQAHIAMMEDNCVKQRKWVTPEEFTEALTVCNLLPGPTSTQLAIWLGYRRGGSFGGILAGIGFILPAFLLLLGLTWFYFRYGTRPDLQFVFAGIAPVVIAILLATCHRLHKSAMKLPSDWLFLVGGFIATLLRVEVALTLCVAGLLGILRAGLIKPSPKAGVWFFPFLMGAIPNDKLMNLVVFFLKAGSVLFGGGLVLIPVLQNEVVNVYGWMTAQEFADGVALGQITPGPVVITATFIGYKAAGWIGALAATSAIFLPSFIFIFLAAPKLAIVRNWKHAQAFLKGTAPTVIGAILTAGVQMAISHSASIPMGKLWFSILLLVLALTALIRYKVQTPWLVLGGGLAGLIFHSLVPTK